MSAYVRLWFAKTNSKETPQLLGLPLGPPSPGASWAASWGLLGLLAQLLGLPLGPPSPGASWAASWGLLGLLVATLGCPLMVREN